MKFMKKNTWYAVDYCINNPTQSMTKVGEQFGIDRHQIAKYKKDNLYLKFTHENKSDLNDENFYYFTEDELAFIDDYISHPTEAYKIIAARHPKVASLSNRGALYHWLEILGLEKTEGGSITYHYDRTKFSTIKTEEDAYWLGFITADGCIIENKWLQIQLAEKDREHLEKFCKYMGLNKNETKEIIKSGFGGAYTRDNQICNIKICSLEIIENLKNKGINPRKSGNEKPYVCATKELEIAYIRGLLDGDGYIRSTQYGMGIVGSYEICAYAQNFITKNIRDISTNKIHEHGTIYKLELSGKLQVIEILKAIYDKANIYLDRKYQLYNQNYKMASLP